MNESLSRPADGPPGRRKYRILCVSETWIGSDAWAAFMGLQRLGHVVQVVNESSYVPIDWKGVPARALRRLFLPVFVAELADEVVKLIRAFRPHCLFIFKGNFVHPRVVAECKKYPEMLAVNFYPDVSFRAHGRYIPAALPLYDHIFNTKSYGVRDMAEQLGVRSVSFLEHGYDPALHRPVELTAEERAYYGSDVAFIGTWSPKKEAFLSKLRGLLPDVRLRVWGWQWEKSRAASLVGCLEGHGVTGEEYTRVICATEVCLGLLSEVRTGASSGDLITARTFQIPACGASMAHERNPEALQYFKEGREAIFFDTAEELAEKVRYYLANPAERDAVARGGLERSHRSGYSIDDRMESVIRLLDERLPVPMPNQP